MEAIIENLTANWAEAIVILLGVATFVARLTPTPKDDAALGIIGRFISQLVPGGLSKGRNRD